METLVSDDGEPFDLEKEYTIATLKFLASGKDGFTMFTDPSVKNLPPVFGLEDPFIQGVMMEWSRNFRKTDEEIANLTMEA